MLTITIDAPEVWDEAKEVFVPGGKEQTLRLEHSLVSISKWEMKYHKSFVKHSNKLSMEESIDYIRFMTLDKNVDPNVYNLISPKQYNKIWDYINDPMSATYIFEDKKGKGRGGSGDTVTSELVYYWMIKFGIPFECQKWHFNRLLTLIKVCEKKESKGGKKMSRAEIIARNKRLNAERRKQMHSKG